MSCPSLQFVKFCFNLVIIIEWAPCVRLFGLVKSIFSSVFSSTGVQTQGRESIAAKLVANLITEAGADRVLACDLHSGQSIGYFDIPVDHVHGQVIIHYQSY